MNLDYYYTFRFYCNALLQQAALFPRHVDRFFSFWRGQYGKRTYAHSRTHSTHHSPLIKKHFGFFFFYYCLFCLCFGILYYYYYYHHYSTVQVTLFVLFQFRFVMLSIILLFFVAFIGYPGVKNSRFTKQRPIITKSIPLYGVQKQKTTEYPISPRTTQSCTSYNHNQQSNPVSVIPCLRPASGNVWQPSSADLNTKRGKPALAMHLTLHRVADRALLVGKPNFFSKTHTS